MPRITNGIESDRVFLLECQGFMFHVLNWSEQRLVVFKKDEFKQFFQGGEVISFHDHHERCDVMMEGRDDILAFMKKTLPFEEYAEFERWELSNA